MKGQTTRVSGIRHMDQRGSHQMYKIIKIEDLGLAIPETFRSSAQCTVPDSKDNMETGWKMHFVPFCNATVQPQLHYDV